MDLVRGGSDEANSLRTDPMLIKEDSITWRALLKKVGVSGRQKLTAGKEQCDLFVVV